jgi:hypothetical protein
VYSINGGGKDNKTVKVYCLEYTEVPQALRKIMGDDFSRASRVIRNARSLSKVIIVKMRSKDTVATMWSKLIVITI